MALVAYRQEKYDEARDWIQQAHRLRATYGVVDKGWAVLLVLDAITAYRLGQSREARKLREAKSLIDELLKRPPDGPNMTLLRDVFKAEILRREAIALIRDSDSGELGLDQKLISFDRNRVGHE